MCGVLNGWALRVRRHDGVLVVEGKFRSNFDATNLEGGFHIHPNVIQIRLNWQTHSLGRWSRRFVNVATRRRTNGNQIRIVAHVCTVGSIQYMRHNGSPSHLVFRLASQRGIVG